MTVEPYSILVVEDERIVARDLQETLCALGYDAFAIASSAEEALARASERRPDIALLDIRIKGKLDGIETAALLRERFGVPVIYLTAHADEATLERAKKTEPQGYLIKPVKSAELHSAIEVSRHRVALERRAREAEAALRASEARYRLIVETAREGICITNLQGRFAYTNRRMEELVGYGPGELLGKHFVDIMDEETAARGLATFERRRRGESEGSEWRLKRADGRDVWVHAEASPVKVDGEFFGVLAMLTDVTEEKLAQEAKERMQAQVILADRLASVGLLAAGVGHEINNPLTFILWNLEMLSRELPKVVETTRAASVADLARMISEARDGAERVRRVVKGLKTFARAEEGKRGRVDVAQIVDLSIDMLTSEIRHRARVEKVYAAAPAVEADEARLGQVFLNLLVNAAHAIPEGHADANEIRVVVGTDAAGRALVEVHDTGSGIPDDVKAKIFDPFFTTKDIGAGTGLGLAVSHGIVQSLGGEISFETTVGKGSAFRVVLPPAGARDVARASEDAAPVQSRARVLIVDDDVMVGRTLKLILESHEVVLATNGREALDIIESGKEFDVILCDLMMPIMTGMDLFAALSAKGSGLTARMIFITGGAFTPSSRKFLDAVPNKVLEKPFDLDTIRACVASFVR
jgi:PAS domain S-box-containing protein